jgi:hypothetical protein
MMSDKTLNLFGELLIKRVRDEAIEQWEKTIHGQMKDEASKRLHNLITTSGQSELLIELIPHIVDTTLHHLLWTLEQEDLLDVTVSEDDNHVSIKEISDGLTGELYTKDGWISRYSSKAK